MGEKSFLEVVRASISQYSGACSANAIGLSGGSLSVENNGVQRRRAACASRGRGHQEYFM